MAVVDSRKELLDNLGGICLGEHLLLGDLVKQFTPIEVLGNQEVPLGVREELVQLQNVGVV